MAKIREEDRAWHGRPLLVAGIELDILDDGALDLPPGALAQLDWVVASIHTRFNQPPAEMTRRLVAAIQSGAVDVIGHPSGRQLGTRDGYEFDLDKVLKVAREAGVAMEVNAMPERMDLTDKACRAAKEAGVKLVISSDAHNASQLENLRYGVWVARRGWIEAADVLNTQPWNEVRKLRGSAARRPAGPRRPRARRAAATAGGAS